MLAQEMSPVTLTLAVLWRRQILLSVVLLEIPVAVIVPDSLCPDPYQIVHASPSLSQVKPSWINKKLLWVFPFFFFFFFQSCRGLIPFIKKVTICHQKPLNHSFKFPYYMCNRLSSPYLHSLKYSKCYLLYSAPLIAVHEALKCAK